jgi:hypothetical protein
VSDAAERHLRRYRSLAHQWDNLLRIPGTPIRLGWDALLGLIPVLGDAAGGLLGSYGLWVGWRQGAPPSVLLRMLLNVLLDVVIGAIPVAGDLFDVGWRSNSRNLLLLERWLDRPDQLRRRSRWLLLGLVALLLLAAAAALALAVWLLHLLLATVQLDWP